MAILSKMFFFICGLFMGQTFCIVLMATFAGYVVTSQAAMFTVTLPITWLAWYAKFRWEPNRTQKPKLSGT